MCLAYSKYLQVVSFHFFGCLHASPCSPHCAYIPCTDINSCSGCQKGHRFRDFRRNSAFTTRCRNSSKLKPSNSQGRVKMAKKFLLVTVFLAKLLFYGMRLLTQCLTLLLYPGLGPAATIRGVAF
uniref:SJCHGC03163 protein n=1 Tax=Schistosoma japonicum TaxID=6182 RepID=Q5DCR7_SCHJA|nr:SJCHGC03163 protein [Schistosoma japonicum]